MNFGTWLANTASRFAQSDSAKRDAQILLSFVTGRSRGYIMAFEETMISQTEQAKLDALVARREQGEPIAYLIGEREFWSLPLTVSSATLIPRPDTECLVELALSLLPDSGVAVNKVLDLGTGTGAIALAIASERKDCQLTGVDYQVAAVACAKHNAAKLQINNAQFLQGSWFEPVASQQFTMICSNPPYIDAKDMHLSQGDVRFEPLSALVADEEGFADLSLIIEQAPLYLESGGWLLLEHGWQQAEGVQHRLRQRGFTKVATEQDYAGNDRISYGCWHHEMSDNQ